MRRLLLILAAGQAAFLATSCKTTESESIVLGETGSGATQEVATVAAASLPTTCEGQTALFLAPPAAPTKPRTITRAGDGQAKTWTYGRWDNTTATVLLDKEKDVLVYKVVSDATGKTTIEERMPYDKVISQLVQFERVEGQDAPVADWAIQANDADVEKAVETFASFEANFVPPPREVECPVARPELDGMALSDITRRAQPSDVNINTSDPVAECAANAGNRGTRTGGDFKNGPCWAADHRACWYQPDWRGDNTCTLWKDFCTLTKFPYPRTWHIHIEEACLIHDICFSRATTCGVGANQILNCNGGLQQHVRQICNERCKATWPKSGSWCEESCQNCSLTYLAGTNFGGGAGENACGLTKERNFCVNHAKGRNNENRTTKCLCRYCKKHYAGDFGAVDCEQAPARVVIPVVTRTRAVVSGGAGDQVEESNTRDNDNSPTTERR